MTDAELRAISDNWGRYPVVGHMPNGAEIRNISENPNGRNFNVREPSGYFCTPIAYACRLEGGGASRRWFTPKWCAA